VAAAQKQEKEGSDAPPPATEKKAPLKQDKEALTAWGKEVGGLQAGLGFRPGEKRTYHTGETVWLVVRVRNVGKKEVNFSYYNEYFYENPPVVTDGKSKPVPLEGAALSGLPVLMNIALAPGKEVKIIELNLALRPASEREKERPVWKLFGTGKFQVQCENVDGRKIWTGETKFDPALSKLATGKLELEIKADPPPANEKKEEDKKQPSPGGANLPASGARIEQPAWGKPLNGLRLGLYQTDPKGDGKPRLTVVLENVGTEDLVLILGQSWARGKKHQLGAMGLNLTYADEMLKRPRSLLSKGSKSDDLADGAAAGPFVVQLVAGGRYTISSDLHDYYDPKDVEAVLAPGKYRVAARFVGQDYLSGWKGKTDKGPRTWLDIMTYWTGTVESEHIQVTVPAKPAK
jgi:hypothetical protein